MKGKGEVSETMLNEIQASQLSAIEFKALVIRKLNELTQKYQKLEGNHNELTAKYINVKREVETINKGKGEMKNTISELKKKPKADLVKQRIGSASWRTRQERNTQKEQEKEKRHRKNEEGLREM